MPCFLLKYGRDRAGDSRPAVQIILHLQLK